MISHQQLIQLIIAYTLAGAFVFTVIITCLSLTGWIKFEDKKQQRKLFACLIVELVVVALGFFAGFLKFDVSGVAYDLVEQGKAIRKLQEEQTGRTLEKDQREKLLISLTKIPHCKIEVFSIAGDREAYSFGKEFCQVLKVAGWQVDGCRQDLVLGGLPPGLQLRQKSTNAPCGVNLQRALETSGLSASLIEMPNMELDSVELAIGYRP